MYQYSIMTSDLQQLASFPYTQKLQLLKHKTICGIKMTKFTQKGGITKYKLLQYIIPR